MTVVEKWDKYNSSRGLMLNGPDKMTTVESWGRYDDSGSRITLNGTDTMTAVED